MYNTLPNLILGFHGCDKEIFDDVICKNKSLKYSKNKYDWLGHGIYFWENNFERAYEFACQKKKWSPKKIKEPAVICATIHLGRCLNLASSNGLNLLKTHYRIFESECKVLGITMPKNRKPTNSNGKDYLFRELDCAVIESFHCEVEKNKLPAYDSVRGLFIEGEPIYKGAGIYEKTHIQLCIRNVNCIKTYATSRETDTDYPIPQ